MCSRPAGPAQSSVFHNSARSGPTKEAHRKAIYSVGGAGAGVVLPVTLPRERPDQAKHSEVGDHCPVTL